jgi:hypothetical protein
VFGAAASGALKSSAFECRSLAPLGRLRQETP